MFKRLISYISVVFIAFPSVSCSVSPENQLPAGNAYAAYFKLDFSENGTEVVSISPFDGSRDSLTVVKPLDRIICMSTTQAAFLTQLDADASVVGLSGVKYASAPALRTVEDVGFDPDIDYEKILSLNPDVVLAYNISAPVPQYVNKLRLLGVPVLMLYEHFEEQPLARAEYIRLFGAIVGKYDEADSLFRSVAAHYEEVASEVMDALRGSDYERPDVLVNAPFGDLWYVPGKSNYMTRLIEDAGGNVLGAKQGTVSGTISIEKAVVLSRSADVWLNPGIYVDSGDLLASHPVFSTFNIGRIYNNLLRLNDGGGNDFWESGAARPDLILEDLVRILSPGVLPPAPFHYYLQL